MPKTLRIDHPIKVNDKPLYAKIKRIMYGTYKVSFYYGKHLVDGTVHATTMRAYLQSKERGFLLIVI